MVLTDKIVIEKALKRYSDRVLMKFVDKEITYREFDQLSTKFANALFDLGLKTGDRVASLMLNKPEGIIAGNAYIKSGLVGVMINPLLAKSDIEYILNDSGTKAVIADFWFLDFIKEKKSNIPSLEHIIGIPSGDEKLPEGVHTFDELVKKGSSKLIEVEPNPDDLIFLGYTGGTTGKPKGVILTQYNMATNAISHTLELDIREGEKLLLMTPLVHAAGVIFFGSMLMGATSVVTPGFNADEALELIEKEKITWLWVVPTMLYRMLDSPKIKEVDLSSVKTIVYGAAPMSVARLREAIDAFGNVFIQLYGQVENPNLISTMNKDDHVYAVQEKEELLKSAGRPTLMCRVKIVDREGKEMGVNEPGTVFAKSPYSMNGYWKLPEKTKETLIDGWVVTGDVGYLDDEGYLYLIDRDKDMIVSGGYNVYSTKVEQAVQEHPDVAMAAVIPVPDKDWGEAVKAMVVLREGAKVTAEELIEFTGDRLAKYEKPKSVDFVESLPLTMLGKVNKRALREPYWKDQERAIH
ncbi:MAG: AMP-binding protein [Candidatus Lokiarchaeia archaeon]